MAQQWKVALCALALFLVALAAGCGPRPDPVTDPAGGWPMIGSWSGTGTQTGGLTWPMEVQIHGVGPGSCANVSYPSIPCTGYWECQGGFDGTTLRGFEHISDGSCVGGPFTLTVTPSGALDFSHHAGDIEGRAILSRR